MKCKECVYWVYEDGPGTRMTHPEDPDTYEPMPSSFEVRACQNPKLLFCERPIESNGFAVADGSNYFAALYTAENFGCVLFEKQTEEKEAPKA